MQENIYPLRLQPDNPLEEKLETKVSIPQVNSLDSMPNDLIATHIAPYLKPAINQQGKKLIAPELRLVSRQFAGIESQAVIEDVSKPKTIQYLEKTTLPIIGKGLDCCARYSGHDFPVPLFGMAIALTFFGCSIPVGTLTAMVGLIHDGWRYYQLPNRPEDPNYINYEPIISQPEVSQEDEGEYEEGKKGFYKRQP